jgi:hypothetical protein
MGVHKPETAKTPSTAPSLGQIGNKKRTGTSNEDGFDPAVAVYEQSYLAS